MLADQNQDVARADREINRIAGELIENYKGGKNMGLFDTLGDMARNKIDEFKEDPAGNIERTVSRSMSKFQNDLEKKTQDIARTAEKNARTMSDSQLRAYAQKVESSGSQLGMEIAQREMERRGM